MPPYRPSPIYTPPPPPPITTKDSPTDFIPPPPPQPHPQPNIHTGTPSQQPFDQRSNFLGQQNQTMQINPTPSKASQPSQPPNWSQQHQRIYNAYCPQPQSLNLSGALAQQQFSYNQNQRMQAFQQQMQHLNEHPQQQPRAQSRPPIYIGDIQKTHLPTPTTYSTQYVTSAPIPDIPSTHQVHPPRPDTAISFNIKFTRCRHITPYNHLTCKLDGIACGAALKGISYQWFPKSGDTISNPPKCFCCNNYYDLDTHLPWEVSWPPD
jgi:hypothetical protein